MSAVEIDYAEVSRWLAVAEARFESKVAPCDDDQKWFDRNQRRRRGWPRLYRLRPTITDDHWLFALGLAEPKEFLTIVRSHELWRVIIARDTATFGPPVDSDAYARMRLMRVPAADRLLRNDSG
jgi:hypothetical protein